MIHSLGAGTLPKAHTKQAGRALVWQDYPGIAERYNKPGVSLR